jgi:hypothetical protein
MAGDYVDISYTSLSRCALIDNGTNLLLQSDQFSSASWTKTRATISADTGSTLAPDGSSSADAIIEDTSTNTHFVSQGVAVSSAVADYAVGVALKPGSRTWAAVSMVESTSSGEASAYFNLSTGALGTVSNGTNWTNARAYISSMGNGWYFCVLVARKTSAGTTVTPRIYLASGNNTINYTGTSSELYAWRATLAQSSVPTRLVQTTSSFTGGTDQTGAGMYTKGWPVSTSGLLLSGDWFEINGELKQLTAPVNSDGLGLAYLQFRPGLAASPADGDPVIVYQPFGRFIYPGGTRELENLFGIYGDCEMNLEEVYV